MAVKAHWKLDGNSNDVFGVNNGSDTSVTYSAANGKIIQGAGFNGSTSKIALTATGLPVGNAARTLNGWVNVPAAGSGGDGCFGYGSVASTGEKCMILMSANKPYFGGHSADLNSNFAINDDAWHMVTFTYAGGTNGAVEICVDDVSKNTGTLTLNTTNQVFRMGCRTTDDQFSLLKLDEWSIWDNVWSADFRHMMYNGGKGLAFPYLASFGFFAAN